MCLNATVGGIRCSVRGKVGWSDLEESSILVSVIVLFSCMFPRNPKDTFFFIFPDQATIESAVNLIYQPLSQFAVATADCQATVLVQVHLCKNKEQNIASNRTVGPVK